MNRPPAKSEIAAGGAASPGGADAESALVRPVRVRLYRWAGAWGPFRVVTPCGECDLTEQIINDVIAAECAGLPVDFTAREWLSQWWEPLIPAGGWHAPIVLVEGRVVSQGRAVNRGVLAEAIGSADRRLNRITGNHLFASPNCEYCRRAEFYLRDTGVDFTYHDVVRNPAALYAAIERLKLILGWSTPIGMPQIWLDGEYIGGAQMLAERLGRDDIETDPRRGRGSLS